MLQEGGNGIPFTTDYGKCRIRYRNRGSVSGMIDDSRILRQPSNSARIIAGQEVDPYLLDRFGFGSDMLLRAVTAGHADAVMTTEHSPATAFGSRFWEGSIRQLRDDLAPREWRALRPGQLEVVRNKLNTVQITTALGDSNVGIRSASPSCEHPRGTSTAKAVEVNQLTFAGLAVNGGWEPIETWWLLYRLSGEHDRTPISELSLPTTMSGKRITEWAVRIILPPASDGNSTSRTVRLPEEPAPVNVPVERRAV